MFVKKLTKIKFKLVNWPFFSLRFSRFCLKLSLEIIFFFFRKSNLHQYIGPFFTSKMTKNGQFLPFPSFYPILMVFLSTFFVKNQIYTRILAIFFLEFSSFLPQIITKHQLLISKIKFTLVYRPFFPFKNDKNGKF